MQVYVKHRLASACIAIHNGPVALICNALRSSDFLGRQVHVTHDTAVVLAEVIDRRNVFTRNNQYMRWRLGIDIAKGNRGFRLVNDVGGYIAIDDLADIFKYGDRIKATIAEYDGGTQG